MSEKILARAREMQKILKLTEPRVGGVVNEMIVAALASADRCVPKSNKIGKQMKFSVAQVTQMVEQCGGDKVKAAKKLKCSVRTIYTVLERGDPKRKRKTTPQPVNKETIRSCVQKMQSALREAANHVRGELQQTIKAALLKADRYVPKSDRVGVPEQFSPQDVKRAVRSCGGDKNMAAEKLGCSLRTIYAAMDRA